MEFLNNKIKRVYEKDKKKYNYIITNLIKNKLFGVFEFSIDKEGYIIIEKIDLLTYNYLNTELSETQEYRKIKEKLKTMLLIPLGYLYNFFIDLKLEILNNEILTNYERHILLKEVNFYIDCSTPNRKEV